MENIIDLMDSQLNKLGEFGKSTVQIIDPTGITNYGDVKKAYNDYEKDSSLSNLALLGIAGAGAVPFIGKFFKMGKTAIAGSKLLKNYNRYKFTKFLEKAPLTKVEEVIPKSEFETTLIKKKPEGIVPFINPFTNNTIREGFVKSDFKLSNILTKTPILGLSDDSKKYLNIWRTGFDSYKKMGHSTQDCLNKADYDLVTFILSNPNIKKKKNLSDELKKFALEIKEAAYNQLFSEDKYIKLGKSQNYISDKRKKVADSLDQLFKRFEKLSEVNQYNRGKLSKKSLSETGFELKSDYNYNFFYKNGNIRSSFPIPQLNGKGFPIYIKDGKYYFQNVVKDQVVLNKLKSVEQNIDNFFKLPQNEKLFVFEALLGKYGPDNVKKTLGTETFNLMSTKLRQVAERSDAPNSSLKYVRRNLNLGLNESGIIPEKLKRDNFSYNYQILTDDIYGLKQGGKIDEIVNKVNSKLKYKNGGSFTQFALKEGILK